jgi:hypothetical protein
MNINMKPYTGMTKKEVEFQCKFNVEKVMERKDSQCTKKHNKIPHCHNTPMLRQTPTPVLVKFQFC